MDLFSNAFKDLGSKSILSDSFSFNDDTPNYSFLSEGIQSDGESKPFTRNFNSDTISEVQPAENAAQRWSREADDLKDYDIFNFSPSKASSQFVNSKPQTAQNPVGQFFQDQQDLWQAEQAQGMTVFKTQDELDHPKTSMEAPVAPQTTPSYNGLKGRQNFADRHGMSGNQYLNAFGRIDARAKQSPRNDIHYVY